MSNFIQKHSVLFLVLTLSLPARVQTTEAFSSQRFFSSSSVTTQALVPSLVFSDQPPVSRLLLTSVVMLSHWQAQYNQLKNQALTSEEIGIRVEMERFVREKVAPVAVLLDQTNEIEIAKELLITMSKPVWAGGPSLVGVAFPAEYGGHGLAPVVESIITEDDASGNLTYSRFFPNGNWGLGHVVINPAVAFQPL